MTTASFVSLHPARFDQLRAAGPIEPPGRDQPVVVLTGIGVVRVALGLILGFSINRPVACVRAVIRRRRP